jgi:predicted metal-binding protein
MPNWVLAMSSLNRKTLIVCKKCHREIHNGTIKQNSNS